MSVANTAQTEHWNTGEGVARTMLAGVDALTTDRAIASVRAALAPHADVDGVRLGASVWLVQAAAS